MAPPQPAPPRPGSLTAQMNEMMDADDDVIAELMADLSSIEEEAVGFRYHADATQESQDRTLRRYESFLRVMKLLPEDATEDERWNIMFPTDFSVLYRQTRL
jgi:hypothetical protein